MLNHFELNSNEKEIMSKYYEFIKDSFYGFKHTYYIDNEKSIITNNNRI